MIYLLKPVYEKCILINTTNSSLLQDIFFKFLLLSAILKFYNLVETFTVHHKTFISYSCGPLASTPPNNKATPNGRLC